MAELFLQELEPEFVAQSTAEDFAFDFLIGIANKDGGVNTYAVEVKATEKPIRDTYLLPRNVFDHFTHSNLPLLLLIVDVKQNAFFYALPTQDLDVSSTGHSVAVPVTRIDDESRESLREKMAG